MATYDLAIRWNDKPDFRSRIKRLNGATVFRFPHYLRCPGGRVLLVLDHGDVGAVFTVSDVKKRNNVILADGKRRPGTHLVAKKGSLRFLKPGKRKVRIRWYGVGQFRYYDLKNDRPILVSDVRGDGNYMDDAPSASNKPHIAKRIAFSGGVPDLPRNDPESQLVRAYVRYLRDEEKLGHDYYSTSRFKCDLFDRTKWRLIEAKMRTDRDMMRTALGQLLDYKRYYQRKPSMGVLLPRRPDKATLAYFESYGVVVVWRDRAIFRDSAAGAWTSVRRR